MLFNLTFPKEPKDSSNRPELIKIILIEFDFLWYSVLNMLLK